MWQHRCAGGLKKTLNLRSGSQRHKHFAGKDQTDIVNFCTAPECSGEVNWLFNVTINDISVIYVTAHRCTGELKKLDLRSGSQRHRHFVGFFNVPILAPTRGHRWFRHTAPFSRLLRSRWGYEGHILDLTPGPSRGFIVIRYKIFFKQRRPREGPGVKSRMCPPYPQRDRKRRLNGAVCRNHRIKRVVPCRC